MQNSYGRVLSYTIPSTSGLERLGWAKGRFASSLTCIKITVATQSISGSPYLHQLAMDFHTQVIDASLEAYGVGITILLIILVGVAHQVIS